jgi:molybdopterin-guanine dinucleotide biosynthesis protein A
MRLCAVIVAGGRSSRMGREKAFELIRGRRMIDRIAATLGKQAQDVVLNAGGNTQRFESLGIPIIPDVRTDIGTPLAGVHAALLHANAEGFDAVLTTPADAPFLPDDLVQRLAAANRPAAIAASAGQEHYLTGLWSRALLRVIERAVNEPRLPRLQDWCGMCDAAIEEWPAEPYDPFFNVNTPEELAQAERIAAEFGL